MIIMFFPTLHFCFSHFSRWNASTRRRHFLRNGYCDWISASWLCPSIVATTCTFGHLDFIIEHNFISYLHQIWVIIVKFHTHCVVTILIPIWATIMRLFQSIEPPNAYSENQWSEKLDKPAQTQNQQYEIPTITAISSIYQVNNY